MREDLRTESEALRTSLLERIDPVCLRFEADWKRGQSPVVEDYLADIPVSEHASFLRELIPIDVEYRRRAGQKVSPHDYSDRFPSLHPDWLAKTVATTPPQDDQPSDLSAVETSVDAKAATPRPNVPDVSGIRCPHCYNPIELVDDGSDEVLCPGCGSSFQLRDTQMTATFRAMRRLGKFELLERVGLGAFGSVWRARDTELDRIVALKIPHASLLTERDDLERFYREARAAAQLRHPGIITVHEVTTLEGLPTIVSDFVEGVTLRDFQQARRLTFRESATLVAQVAEALDYAHELGLVHRDVKPANIMVEFSHRGAADQANSVKAQEGKSSLGVGKPLVLDFGLALRETAEITMTLEGQLIGTPAYMSPEQAAGHGHRVDRRSDVYSLGVVLYELLCGELPFRGSTALLRHQLVYEDPRSPRRINDKIPRDLETICLKAMAKEPARRYATARELADDLERFLKGEPIQARPVGTWERAWVWAKRRPAAAALIIVSAIAALALVAGGVGWWFNARLQEEFEKTQVARRDEQQQRERAEGALALADEARKAEFQQRQHAETLLYIQRYVLAEREWHANNVGRARELLKECPTNLRGWEWGYLDRLCHMELRTLDGHKSWVGSVAFSPDGKWLASASHDKTVKIWDAATGMEAFTLEGHTIPVACVAFSADGTRLASAGDGQLQRHGPGEVKLWDVATWSEIRSLEGIKQNITSVAFSPSGQHLATSVGELGKAGAVTIWDATTGKELRTHICPAGAVACCAFSPDGRYLVSATSPVERPNVYTIPGEIKVWDVLSGQEVHTLRGHAGSVGSVEFSPDSKRLASASFDKTVKIWDPATGRELKTLRGHTADVGQATWHPDGQRLACASVDGTVTVWDATTGEQLLTLRGHTGAVASVDFHPKGELLASGGWDGTVNLWDPSTDLGPLTLRGFQEAAIRTTFSPDGRYLTAARDGAIVRLWDPATGQRLLTLRGHAAPVQDVTFSSDSRWVATASEDTVKVWDVDTGREVLTRRVPNQRIKGVALSPDGQYLASLSRKSPTMGEVKIWDIANGMELLTIEDRTESVRPVIASVAFSPDGRRLVTCNEANTLKLWDATTGQEIHTFRGHTAPVLTVVFSPDGRNVASASDDATAKVWDTTSFEEVCTLRSHSREVIIVAYNRDGTRLATASNDQTVKIWDAASGQEMLTLRGHTDRVFGVAFSQDGQRLATSSADQTVKVWEATPLTPELRLARQAAELVNRLAAEPLAKEEVRARLRHDATLAEPLRQQALTMVDRYREDSYSFYEAGLPVVNERGADEATLRIALRHVETAVRLAPENSEYLRALGGAQYRLGKFHAESYAEALATLAKCDPNFPSTLAFLAMTQYQLGQNDQARSTLSRLREIMKEPQWETHAQAQALLGEAAELIDGASPPQRTP